MVYPEWVLKHKVKGTELRQIGIHFKNNGETKSQQMHFQKSSNILPYSA
jgi:hypothetical protein